MRFFTTSLAIVAVALAFTACAGKSSSDSSDQTAATTTAAAADTSAAATATAGASAEATTGASDEVPTYPGATTQASGTSSGAGDSMATGKILSTSDSFGDVYAWYQKNMPQGSEKAHVTTPVESAVFTLGDPGKAQTSVTINTSAGKTMITIAHVKM